MTPLSYEKFIEPFKDLAELNMKTLQQMSYLTPSDLANMKNPEEVVEKQIKITMDNSYKALEHMQKTFQIIEKAMLSFTPDVIKKH